MTKTLSNQSKVRLKHIEEEGQKAMAEIASVLTGKIDNPVGVAQGAVAALQLKSFIERIERLVEEKSALQEDIKEVFAEAKGYGFDVKTMRRILRLRGMDEQKRREAQELLDTYAAALGMQYTLL